MKNLVFALSLALASGLAVAQPGMGGGEPHWLKGIDLTDAQRAEMRKVRREGGSKDDVMSVLTPEQREKISELKGSRGGAAGDGLERMKRHLQLSDEQAAEMKKIREEGGSREDMLKVLTPEQQEQLQHAEKRRKGKKGERPPAPSEAPAEETPEA